MKNEEAITKLLQKLHRKRHTPDLHSFKAKIAAGVVYVEAEEDGIFMELFTYDADGNETRERMVASVYLAARELERRGLDLATVET